MKIVVIGNSIVNGFPFRRSQCFTSLLRTEYGYETINKGVNGDTTGGVLMRFSEDALKSRSDRILILTATNDFIAGGSVDTAMEHMKTMISMAGEKKVIALTPLLTHPALAGRMWMRADYETVNRKLREFAERLKEIETIDVIDTQTAYAGFLEETSARDAYVDGIHPREEGHEFLASYIAEKLREMDI